MPIDQMGLNNLLSIIQPKNSLDVLREKREGIWKKLNQGKSTNADTKQVIVELQAADKQIQQAVYEETSRKLEIERLKREEAAAKTLRERERALAKHERVLYNASMNKLFSAIDKSYQFGTMVGTGAKLSFNYGFSEINSDCYPRNSLMKKAEEINGDIKESIEFGIAAAEVARRRKNNCMKEQTEATIYKNDAIRKRKKKNSINMTV